MCCLTRRSCTPAAEVGNHCIGVRPCAGTGDPCPYTGFLRALMDVGTDETTLAEVACLMLKVGSLFRVAKVTTGCNLEGYGAGSAAIAAATVHLKNGTPEQMEKAMVLAMSPTIGVPCTPRVLVPALCTAHVGGAILGGMYAGRLCTTVEMTVNVPFDVMFAMASLVHKESAHHIVPTVVEYMEPFFQRTAEVESLVSEEVHKADKKRIEETLEKAKEIAKKMADGSAPIIKTLGDAVVGGSSQAVGSPTNCGRIAHELLNEGEKVTEITIELYPELFARRTINVPGVLMGAVYGCSTSDYKTYEVAVERVKADGVKVNIVRGEEYQIQKVTLVTDKGNSVMVDTLNRGGGRLVLRNATPSLEKAQEAAKKLGFDEHQVFKTLMADTGSERVVGVVPVSGHMDLKALAAAVGAKKASMADPKVAMRESGYVVGGISPLGQRTHHRTVLDESALQFDEILLSGGKRGFSVGVNPHDLLKVLNAVAGPIGTW